MQGVDVQCSESKGRLRAIVTLDAPANCGETDSMKNALAGLDIEWRIGANLNSGEEPAR
ncbi:MAG: hypothetical protein CPDRYMAC_6435 [uncultured Paraburkholderia sp.]|nr:MAG: hypothetical protein CPDRYDRY_6359 [uncultured Paraburkholderia sp.]CAH2944460.1 MAG: hypothetical protein CPDRYMAC_6435 [uncultured Paraburkholderia sp.]